MTDGEQTKNQTYTPLASAAQRVKDKDVEIIAISTKPEDEINVDDLRDIASGVGDENVFVVTPNQPSPVITSKVSSKVKRIARGKEQNTIAQLIFHPILPQHKQRCYSTFFSLTSMMNLEMFCTGNIPLSPILYIFSLG